MIATMHSWSVSHQPLRAGLTPFHRIFFPGIFPTAAPEPRSRIATLRECNFEIYIIEKHEAHARCIETRQLDAPVRGTHRTPCEARSVRETHGRPIRHARQMINLALLINTKEGGLLDIKEVYRYSAQPMRTGYDHLSKRLWADTTGDPHGQHSSRPRRIANLGAGSSQDRMLIAWPLINKHVASGQALSTPR